MLAARVNAGLVAVEDLLTREVVSEFPFITEAASHLMMAGGKRFRPLFTLVSGSVGPRPDAPELVTAGAVVELIHLATLYHDDVMDEASLRRGASSANARWGNSVAILTGDFLFAHASRLVSTLGTAAVCIIAETFAELVTGQTRESMGPAADDDPVAFHLRVLDEKTASLIDTCARYAGMFSGCSDSDISALRRFGRAIGVAFQISDDIIDMTSSSSDSGKLPGTDLREGVRTLPVLYTLSSPDSSPELLDLVASPVADADLPRALALLAVSPGMEQARATLETYAASARSALGELPDSAAVDALESLVTFVVQRVG